MGYITKRNGRWQANYRGPDKRERTKTFDRKVDAESWLSTVTADVVRGDWVDPRRARVLFKDWTDEWWATSVGNRASTRARDESYLRTHIRPTFDRMPLGAIGHMDVRAWVADLSKRRKPATVHKAFQILAQILQSAVDAEVIKASPCHKVPLPKIEHQEMRFLAPGQIAALADVIDSRYRALVLVGSYGGLRIGELAALRRQRVDLLRGRIEVAETVVEVRGHLEWNQPKTRAGRRTVTLPRPVTEELAAHMNGRPGELVFSAPQGGPLRVPAWRRRFWLPAVKAAQLDGLRPHDMRHTAVALWIATGANPLEVSRRAGHRSTSFTLDRYGHLFPNADQGVADRLEALLVTSAPPAAGPARIAEVADISRTSRGQGRRAGLR